MDAQWDIMNKRLVEIEEETRKKVERLNQELAEKDSIIQQLTANIEELSLGQSSQTAASSESSELINEYQAKIASFDQEREKYEAEISTLNEKLSNLEKQVRDSGSVSAQTNALKEQLGVFQEFNKQLETEKNSLENELKELKEKEATPAELPAQLSALQEINKKLEIERQGLETELQLLKEKPTGTEDLNSEINKLREENQQLLTEKENLEGKIATLEENLQKETEEPKEKPESDISGLQEENSNLKNEIQTFQNEKENLLQQIQTLQAQAESKSIEEPEHDALLAENQKLKKDLEDLNKELDEIIANNRDQAQKIEELEATLASVSVKESAPPAPKTPSPATPPMAKPKPPTGPSPVPAPAKKPSPGVPSMPKAIPISPTKPSAPATSKYFSFSNGVFVPTDKKPQGIILECNTKEKLWILTIEPTVTFLDKNKALRVARSLPTTGFKIGVEKFGIGFQLKIYGEF